MDKHDERAEKIARWYKPVPSKLMILNIAAQIREAVQESLESHIEARDVQVALARASALEEAAKVAETTEAKENSIAWQAHKNIAEEIRALAKKETKMKNSELFNGPLGEDHRTFTDDDLNRLKQLINEDYAIYRLDEPTTRALIARTEASERKGKAASELREAGQAICDPCTYSLLEREFELADKAWRAAAGKS